MINKDTTDRISLYVPKKMKKAWEKQAKRDAKIMQIPRIPLNVWIISRVSFSTEYLAE